MIAIINGNNYLCRAFSRHSCVLTEVLTDYDGEEIDIVSNDGFHMAVLRPSGWLRWFWDGTTITMTNDPEPEEPDEDEEPEEEELLDERVGDLEGAVLDLAEAVSNNELTIEDLAGAIMELGELLAGEEQE